MKMYWKISLGLLLSMSMVLAAAPTKERSETPVSKATEPVEGRPKVEQGYVPEPIVSIRDTKKEKIEEYRINGVLRAIKVTPKNGLPSYYLVDKEATGVFTRFGPDTDPGIIPPSWILFRW